MTIVNEERMATAGVSPSQTPYEWVGTRPVRTMGSTKYWSRSFCRGLDIAQDVDSQVLRSPYAHARILSIDTTSAEAMPRSGSSHHREGLSGTLVARTMSPAI